jgi:hypothetical protein
MPIRPIDPYDVELALICEANPRINMHGIKRWRRENIEVTNSGVDFTPLPQSFRIMKGEKCQGA